MERRNFLAGLLAAVGGWFATPRPSAASLRSTTPVFGVM